MACWSHEGDCYCEAIGCRSSGTRLIAVKLSGRPEGRGEWCGTCPRCGAVSHFELVNPPYEAPGLGHVMEVAAQMLLRGRCMGRRYSVGAYKLATEPPRWAVLDLPGAPVFEGDVYDCAREFVLREAVVS